MTVPALETRRARFLNLSSGRPSLTQGALPGGMCQCHQPSLLQKQSSGIREQLTLPILQKNQKVPSPPRKKKILIKNHQFISLLYNARTACNFQFFPQLPVKIPTPLPSTQGQEFQGALAKRANLQQFLKVCI